MCREWKESMCSYCIIGTLCILTLWLWKSYPCLFRRNNARTCSLRNRIGMVCGDYKIYFQHIHPLFWSTAIYSTWPTQKQYFYDICISRFVDHHTDISLRMCRKDVLLIFTYKETSARKKWQLCRGQYQYKERIYQSAVHFMRHSLHNHFGLIHTERNPSDEFKQ